VISKFFAYLDRRLVGIIDGDTKCCGPDAFDGEIEREEERLADAGEGELEATCDRIEPLGRWKLIVHQDY